MSLSLRRIALLAAAIAALAITVVIAPAARIWCLNWAAARADARVDPHPASDLDEAAILTQVLEGSHDFEGLPPPPPGPSRDDEAVSVQNADAQSADVSSTDHDDIILVDTTAQVCDTGDAGKDDRRCQDFRYALRPPLLDRRIPRQLAREFLLVNSRQSILPMMTIPHTRRILAARFESISDGGRGWWRNFYQQFPDTRGVSHGTRAVLTEDGQHALIYVQGWCEGDCGLGAFYYLARNANGWMIEARQVLWES